MTIIFPLNAFFEELFPEYRVNPKALENALKEFYTLGSSEPKIEIHEDHIKVIISNEAKIEKNKYNKLISLCESSRFEQAKGVALDLIEKVPASSEYHRILGQIYSELGDQEEAINSLINALRWDPKNIFALLMMGNIFAKFKEDIETALAYYDQALKVDPKDHITLNNIGANLMQLNKKEEAKRYFEKALESNPNYPNTYQAIGVMLERDGDYLKAFEKALIAIEKNPKKDGLFQSSLQLALESSKNYLLIFDAKNILNETNGKLAAQTNVNIKIEINESISTAAKIEYAENYNRDHHLIKYKSSYPAVDHLILHELIHLELAIEAREEDSNKLFISNENHRSKFLNALEKDAARLKKLGNTEDSILNYLNAIFSGMNSQVFNAPIDLFIEDRIYKRWPEFRPLQFLSLFSLAQEGINATTNQEFIKNAPAKIISNSKIYNITNAFLFKDLYKVDLINDHKPTKSEFRQAESFYNEFLEYRKDKGPGEEYELLQHWAEDLQLDSYFDLIAEDEHRRKTIEDVLSEIKTDPFNAISSDPSNDRKMQKFLKENSAEDTNLAVVMYMVDALKYFEKLSQEEIKKIAFEIATIGMGGIDPKKERGYEIPSILNSNFSGYKTLAYYYVSWALAMPEMLKGLQMPFDKEYELSTSFNSL